VKLSRFFGLFFILTTTVHFAHSNPLHRYLESKDVDVRSFYDLVRVYANPNEALNEPDEHGLTVLGTAIQNGHQSIVELLLRWGFTVLGPRYSDLTLAQFAFRVRQIPLNVFLTYYEHDILDGFRVEEALERARLQQRDFNRREVRWRASLRPLPPPPPERLLGPGGYLSDAYHNLGRDG